jgi:hypothetical protein
MYRKNEQHKQCALFSSVSDLPDKQRERLETSWAATFYEAFFCRVDEDIFAVLYSDQASRPNAPVNVLVGLEVLKSGFGWSDAQLEEQLAYNVQVRYALGYRDLSAGHVELRTVYNFRSRLTRHMETTGENLLEQVFEQVTDEQIEALAIKTDKLRVDSTLVASNIRHMSRLQLLVEVLQRTWRMLSEVDQTRYREVFAPYVKDTSRRFTYHIERDQAQEHLARIGLVMFRLIAELKALYADDSTYQILARVFAEHFILEDDGPRLRTGDELGSGNLQSPDDTGATFRVKRGEGYQGYVTNVTETCDPDNDIQLIVKVQTASNTADDAQMLNHAIPNLVARTDVDEVYTDGGYNSPVTDKILQEYHIEQYQTAIRGTSPRDEDHDPLRYSDFVFERTPHGFPLQVRCPQGQQATVETTYTEGRFRAAFDAEVCATCPLLDRCPTFPLKRRPHRRHLRFGQQDVNIAHRHANMRKAHASEHNLRSAVEATVRSLKHPFGNDKLPVRGHARMSMMMVAGAAMVNIRRLWRRVTAPSPATPAAAALATHQPCILSQSFSPSCRFLRSPA